MTTVFDHEEFHGIIRDFGNRVPDILRDHPITADLAETMSPIREIADVRFTLAVVGQMRSGKSSLLNSLVGQPLAVVGVNETTATINWFKYGTDDLTSRFRVTWDDGSTDDLDLDRIGQWVGDSENARKTAKIEFFSDSDFLKVANIVDTPGTRSVLESHEETIQNFLAAENQEDRTLREGGRADAILYVIPPVAGSTDEELLRTFETSTRLPGSTPYNSLAVLHKWETLNSPDPFAEAIRKAEIASKALDGLVAEVIPVSAPLAWAASQFPREYWSAVTNLSQGTSPDALSRITKSDRHFCSRSEPDCLVPPEKRKELFHSQLIPWPSFRAILGIANSKSISDPEDLRVAVEEVAGLSALKSELQSRFFARSLTIKCFSTLAKAVIPCRQAQIRLQNHKSRLQDAIQDATKAKEILSDRIDRGDFDLSPALRYIHETLENTNRDFEKTGETLRRVGTPLSQLLAAYESMELDLQCIEELKSMQKGALPGDWMKRLAILFGQDGMSLSDRMGVVKNSDGADLIRAIEELRSIAISLDKSKSKIIEHGIDRLESLVDIVEETSGENMPSTTIPS